MAEHTNTGSVPTTTGSTPVIDNNRRWVYRTTDGVTEHALITRGEYKTYRTEGWSTQDPAFVPDADVVKAAVDNDGVIAMHSNLGGIPKQVAPEDVAWHLQNGWAITSRLPDNA